jgi:hypothetical protein
MEGKALGVALWVEEDDGVTLGEGVNDGVGDWEGLEALGEGLSALRVTGPAQEVGSWGCVHTVRERSSVNQRQHTPHSARLGVLRRPLFT